MLLVTTTMDMMLLLPTEQQSDFADGEWKHFSGDPNFNDHKLFKFEVSYMGEDDPRADEQYHWTLSTLGNIAYMSLHAPVQYRTRWGRVRDRFIEFHKLYAKMS
jgi:hypothetical protein